MCRGSGAIAPRGLDCISRRDLLPLSRSVRRRSRRPATAAMSRVLLFLALVGTAAGFNLTPLKTAASKHTEAVSKASAAATALSISLYSQAASAKSVLGVNGALDFGPLAGDQPGGEGTGKVRTNLGVC
eukprot:5621162-Pleurochrysis_carterae.AAC.1